MLSEEEAIELLKEHDLPEGIIEHSKGVGSRAAEMASRIPEVDEKMLKIAGLLHDIGKGNCMGDESDEALDDHALESGRILRELGEEKLARICERHSASELAENGLEDYSLEEKILILSDMQTMGGKQVSMEERLDDLFSRYSDKPHYIESLRKSLPKYMRIRREINSRMNEN